MKFNLPHLPNFRLTQEEIEDALESPVLEKHRFGEITVHPEGAKPRASNRILIRAYDLYMQDKPMDFAALLKSLFLLWAMGRIVVLQDGQEIITSTSYVSKPKSEEFDFNLDDLMLDDGLTMPQDYDFGDLS